jgi:hypothetical protein
MALGRGNMCLWSQTACETLRYIVGRFYGFGVDAFTQKRVLELRDEIASLQHENQLYWSRKHCTLEQEHANDFRRSRLLAIREELKRLSQKPTSDARPEVWKSHDYIL